MFGYYDNIASRTDVDSPPELPPFWKAAVLLLTRSRVAGASGQAPSLAVEQIVAASGEKVEGQGGEAEAGNEGERQERMEEEAAQQHYNARTEFAIAKQLLEDTVVLAVNEGAATGVDVEKEKAATESDQQHQQQQQDDQHHEQQHNGEGEGVTIKQQEETAPAPDQQQLPTTIGDTSGEQNEASLPTTAETETTKVGEHEGS